MIRARKSLQRIAGACRNRHCAVPKFDRSCCRNDNAQWYDFAPDVRGRGGERPDLADQLVLDAISLLDVDMDYLAVVRKIDTGIVAVEAAATDYVSAAHDAKRR